jgi:hypothetical protein
LPVERHAGLTICTIPRTTGNKMTAQVLAFTGSKKPRRETKADIAARVVPKALGILTEADVYGVPGHVSLYRKAEGFHIRAGSFADGSLILLTIHDKQGKELLRGYIPRNAEGGDNVTLGGWFRISRMDFAGRAAWVPTFNALPTEERGVEGLFDLLDGLNQAVLAMT